MQNSLTISEKFFISAATLEGEFISCSQVIEWVKKRNSEVEVCIDLIKFSEMKEWSLDRDKGRICHQSGGFFSIEGIKVEASFGPTTCWDQPIINQPEIGFLGCIVKEFNGVLYFLVQAKIEPGNVNNIQLSPTLQATRSNYTRKHKGAPPKFLNYFNGDSKSNILLDQLQSEQGSRFLKKRNRNIIVQVEDEIGLDDDFQWITLGQIKKLLAVDNLVNMDLRTVISGIQFDLLTSSKICQSGSYDSVINGFGMNLLNFPLDSSNELFSLSELNTWLIGLKATNSLMVERVPLAALDKWAFSDSGISHMDQLYFDVCWVSVAIENREVSSWNQPIIRPLEIGIVAFIVKKINGTYHFLVQAKLEPGNFDIFEFGPTVQCSPGLYKNSLTELPYLKYVLGARQEQIRYRSVQSEEGGRFYHEQNQHLIIEADEGFEISTPNEYRWMSFNQLLYYIQFSNSLNIQARSLISLINFI